MGLFIATEKRAKLTNIFVHSLLMESKGNYSLLVGQKNVPRNNEIESKLQEAYFDQVVSLLRLPPEALYENCAACYAYLRI